MAQRIPGKEEFRETIRYFQRQIELTGVKLRLNTRVTAGMISAGGFDEVALCTGVSPRRIELEGADHPMVLTYIDVLLHGRPVGRRAAIIGAGGIGFDVAEFLCHEEGAGSPSIPTFMEEWGVDMEYRMRGALTRPLPAPPAREVYLCQRSGGKPGAGLGKTTGWIHRSSLRMKKVEMLAGVQYQRIDGRGLHLIVKGEPKVLEVDNVIICAGQEPLRELWEPLKAAGVPTHLIGGAHEARELDAKRAIAQAARLAAEI